jgi:hypothetical protein
MRTRQGDFPQDDIQPNLSLEATRLRRDDIAGAWTITLVTYRGRRAWAAVRLSSDR